MTAPTNVSEWPRSGPYSPPITIILATALLVVFFVGFFSVCLCRCLMENIASTWHLQRTPSGNLVSVACAATRPGLDPSQIQTFPTFAYSTVKDFRKEKYGLECAICLSEFETESMLRLLTVCYHVFHQECIDLWLKSHKTCPVCRRMLDPTDGTFGKASSRVDIDRDGNEPASQDAVRIDITDDDREHEHEHGRNGEEKDGEGGEKAGTSGAENNEKCEGKLERSHTTGHSIVRYKKKEDKYTLRLPEHVRRRILRGHNWTGSCTTFEDISKNMANETYGESGFSGGTS